MLTQAQQSVYVQCAEVHCHWTDRNENGITSKKRAFFGEHFWMEANTTDSSSFPILFIQ